MRGTMTLGQSVIFWLTVIGWLSLFFEQPAPPAVTVDGLTPVNRDQMKGAK
jgi:hypothetical protein